MKPHNWTIFFTKIMEISNKEQTVHEKVASNAQWRIFINVCSCLISCLSWYRVFRKKRLPNLLHALQEICQNNWCLQQRLLAWKAKYWQFPETKIKNTLDIAINRQNKIKRSEVLWKELKSYGTPSDPKHFFVNWPIRLINQLS